MVKAKTVRMKSSGKDEKLMTKNHFQAKSESKKMEVQNKMERTLVIEISDKNENLKTSNDNEKSESDSKEIETINEKDSSDQHDNKSKECFESTKGDRAEDDDGVYIKAEVEMREAMEDESFELTSDSREQSILKARLQGLLPDSEIIVGSGEYPTFNHFMTSLDDTNVSCVCLCHITRPPEDKQYRCGTCEELLCCKCLWQAHNVAHKNDTRFVCHICGKSYHYKSDLKRHLIVHDVIRPHQCEVCDKRFNQVGHLMTHRLTHTGEKPFLCDVCSKAFNRKSNLLKHKLIHSGDRPFVCEECNSTFTRKGDLGRHRLLHTGEKPFACTLCDKAFTQKPHLVNHQVVHTGVKPFTCDGCDKSFNRKSNLVKHQKLHFKEVPVIKKKGPYFTCEHCNATFFEQSTLEEHRDEHGNTDLYSCSMCDKSFSHRPLLISHQGTHHNVQPFICNFCNKTFNSLIFFRKHQTAHVKRLINEKDHSLIYKTVSVSENFVSVKEEPIEDTDDSNSMTEESCPSNLPPNSESSIDCDRSVTFIGVADLLKGGHKTAKTLTRKKSKNNYDLRGKEKRQGNEDISNDNCSTSSEDSQFRLLNALQLQINYHSDKSDNDHSDDDSTSASDDPNANKIKETIISNGLTPSKSINNLLKDEGSGQILRKILSATVTETEHCNNRENKRWNTVPAKQSHLKS